MNHLKKLRDELAEKYSFKTNSYTIGRLDEAFKNEFKEGWDAAIEHCVPLVEALEWISESSFADDDELKKIRKPGSALILQARSALAKFRGENGS